MRILRTRCLLLVLTAVLCMLLPMSSASAATLTEGGNEGGDTQLSSDFTVASGNTTVKNYWVCGTGDSYRYKVVNDVTGGATAWITTACDGTVNSHVWFLGAGRYFVWLDRLGPTNVGTGSYWMQEIYP